MPKIAEEWQLPRKAAMNIIEVLRAMDLDNRGMEGIFDDGYKQAAAKAGKPVENAIMEEKEGRDDGPASTGDIAKDFLASMAIRTVPGKSHIVAVAQDVKDGKANSIIHVPCGHCQTFGGYAYDGQKDTILVECIEAMSITTLPVMMEVSCEAMGPWKVAMPLPPVYAEHLLNPQQRRKLKAFRDKYRDPRYRVFMIQMRGVN